MNVVSKEDFNEDFIIGEKIGINPRRISTKKKYLLSPKSGIEIGNPSVRAYVEIDSLTGLGIIHLDFTSRLANTPGSVQIFNLPADCPKPLSIIESSVSTGSIYLTPDIQVIYAQSLPRDTRHIVNLVGFFES